MMKTIFDSSFKYRPSFDTDVRKTFCRVRRQQQVQILRAPRCQSVDEQACGRAMEALTTRRKDC